MPSITLSTDEVAPGVLPPVCPVCGVPAATRSPVTFSWVPAWSYVLLLAGIWPWILVYLIVRREMTVDLAVCERDRYHWVWRKWLLPAGLLLTALILIAPAVLDLDSASSFPTWALVVPSTTFLTTLAAAVRLRLNGVRAVAVTREAVTLAGVAPEFVAAVEAGRADYARQMAEWVGRHDRPAGDGEQPSPR